MHKILITILFILSYTITSAQEIFCKIRINDVQVQISDKSIFRGLEQRLTEFVNNTKWTQEPFTVNEKIELNIEIILSGYDQNSYEYQASAIIQTRRPIYGTNYTSTLFSFNDENFNNVNLKKLNSIVFTESTKSYLNKEVDKENKIGAFGEYKKFVENVSDIVLELNPKYKYPNMLISTVIEGAHLQHHFTEHLPRLTNISRADDHIQQFFTDIVFKSIKSTK